MMMSIKLKYKNMEEDISIDSTSYIGELVEKALSKFNTFIFSIEDIYCYYENDEFIKLGKDNQAIFSNKMNDIINDDKKCDMITFFERNRDIHNNVTPNNLQELYDNYQHFKRDEDMALSLNNRYRRLDNIYSNIIQSFETLHGDNDENSTNQNDSEQDVTNHDDSNQNESVLNYDNSTRNGTVSFQPSIEAFMNNIQDSFINNNTGVRLTATPFLFGSNLEAIQSSTLTELSNNVMSSLNTSITNNIFNTIFSPTRTGINSNDDVKVTMKNDENKDLKIMKYQDLTDEYCSTQSIVKTTDCTICLENFEDSDDILLTNCKHLFHKKCAEKWLTNYSVKCPICKNKIVKGEAQVNDS